MAPGNFQSVNDRTVQASYAVHNRVDDRGCIDADRHAGRQLLGGSKIYWQTSRELRKAPVPRHQHSAPYRGTICGLAFDAVCMLLRRVLSFGWHIKFLTQFYTGSRTSSVKAGIAFNLK